MGLGILDLVEVDAALAWEVPQQISRTLGVRRTLTGRD